MNGCPSFARLAPCSFLIWLLTFAPIIGPVMMAQTTVPAGDVSGAWTLQGSPYLIEGDITVPTDSALTIEPGVRVEFQGHFELLVHGRLLAIGTETDSILFTINDTTGWSNAETTAGGWKHIRLFDIPAGTDSTILDYCRIEFGKAIGPNWPFNHGGGISITAFNNVRISHCLIVNNMSGGQEGPTGGGVGVTSCDIVLCCNTIAYNRSAIGGGIHLFHSNSVLRGNVIRGNSATNGGGMEIVGDASRTSVVSLDGDTIAGNVSGPGAGGINAYDLDSLNARSVTFVGNQSRWGGAIGSFHSGLFFQDCVFRENSSGWLGGGIAADYCSVTIDDCEFTGNLSADAAGAMHNDHCTVRLSNSVFRNNTAGSDTMTGAGGGINCYATSLDIHDSEFLQNSTAGIGGALNVDSTALVISGSSIASNTARYAGGGLHANRSTVTIESSFVTGNSVGNDTIAGVGGGLRTAESDVTVRNSQIDGNRALGIGGGLAALTTDLSVAGSSLNANHATWRGGGILVTEGRADIRNSELRENVAGTDSVTGVGGGLDAWGAGIVILESAVSRDTAGIGGGVSIYNCDLSAQDVQFDRNRAHERDGALSCTVDSTLFGRPFVVRIEDSRFYLNDAGSQHAGMRIAQSTDRAGQVAVTIDRCSFSNNSSAGSTSLRLAGAMRDFLLTNSVFIGNRSVASSSEASTVRGWGTVSSCLFAGNIAGSDTAAASVPALGAIQGARIKVVNCTMVGNETGTGTILALRTGSVAWLVNNILWGSKGHPIILNNAGWDGECHVWVDHSLVEGGADSVTLADSLSVLHWGAGNLDQDPLFVNAGTGDYRLQAASPCIGAGVDSIEIDGEWLRAPAADLTGKPRPAPQGTRPDMGAHEEGVTVAAVNDRTNGKGMPVTFALHQNYPNPFNPFTKIQLTIADQYCPVKS